MLLLGYSLAILIGLSLGLIGSGGSILNLPILVYLMSVPATEATLYSLMIVGTTALYSLTAYVKNKLVNLQTGLVFGIPSLLATWSTRKFIFTWIPERLILNNGFSIDKSALLMMAFSLIMLMVGYRMLKSTAPDLTSSKTSTSGLLLMGLLTGFISGMVGAGGGFIIVPALILFGNLNIKTAAGTSLLVIFLNSATAVMGNLNEFDHANWKLLIPFTALSIGGSFIGTKISGHLASAQLKKIFSYFVMTTGTIILIKEIITSWKN